MSIKSTLILLAAFTAAGCTFMSCHHPSEPSAPPQHRSIDFRATFAAPRWAKLQLRHDSTAASKTYVVRRGSDTLFHGDVRDSLILKDSTLTPGTTFTWEAERLYGGAVLDTATATATTPAVTKTDYAWEVLRFGTGPNPSIFYGIWAASTHSIWVCGTIDSEKPYSTAVFHVTDSGVASVVDNGPSGDYFGCWGASDSSVYFVGNSTILHWTGHRFEVFWFNGDTLPELKSGLMAVWVTPDDREVFAVGKDGIIVHRKPDRSWELMESGITSGLYSVTGFASDDVWAMSAAGDYTGELLHYDGHIWTVAVSTAGTLADTCHLDGAPRCLSGSSRDSAELLTFYNVYMRPTTACKPVPLPLVTAHGAKMNGFDGRQWNRKVIGGESGLVLINNGEYWERHDEVAALAPNVSFLAACVVGDQIYLVGDDWRSNRAVIMHGR
jgi:hypothetical protein